MKHERKRAAQNRMLSYLSRPLGRSFFDSLFVEHYVEYFLIGFAHTLAGKLAY